MAVFFGVKSNVETLLYLGADPNEFEIDRRLKDKFASLPHVAEAKDVVLRHYLKLKLVNLLAAKKLPMLAELENAEYFEAIYKKDLEKMGKTFICEERNITYLHLLKKALRTIVLYLNIDEIVEGLGGINFDVEFPNYAGILQNRLKEAEGVADFIGKSYTALQIIFADQKLPHTVLHKIFTFLTDKDLENISTIS